METFEIKITLNSEKVFKLMTNHSISTQVALLTSLFDFLRASITWFRSNPISTRVWILPSSGASFCLLSLIKSLEEDDTEEPLESFDEEGPGEDEAEGGRTNGAGLLLLSLVKSFIPDDDLGSEDDEGCL